MRTTVTIPDEMMQELMEITGADNMTKAVTQAIEAHIRHHRVNQLRQLRGKVAALPNDEIEAPELADLWEPHE